LPAVVVPVNEEPSAVQVQFDELSAVAVAVPRFITSATTKLPIVVVVSDRFGTVGKPELAWREPTAA